MVGGNVLTSQRLVDVVFRAFGTCAASQGCMNNTTFGDATIGYYETVAGGAGAVSGFDLGGVGRGVSLYHFYVLVGVAFRVPVGMVAVVSTPT